MELIVGSNVIRNTSGILKVQGKEQLSFEWGQPSHELLLTMNLYNAGGQHIARVWRNEWTFNDSERFELRTRNPRALKLIETKTGQVVLEARVVGQDQIEIPQGTFYSQAGHRLEITPDAWRIRGLTVGGKIIESGGGPVTIG